MSLTELQKKLQQHQQGRNDAAIAVQQHSGAIAVLEQLIAEWPKTEPIVEESPE